jgi:cytochrome o ubiquinol oxidase operon protein cyoD
MQAKERHQPDFGTGQKKLSTYLIGLGICTFLTLFAFWIVMSRQFSSLEGFIFIYAAACLQFVAQLIFFLRLNTQTEQGRVNVMSLVFTGVVLITVIIGTLWIMSNLNYYMVH